MDVKDSQVRITILLENRARDGLLSEHGVSFWIEADGMKLLLDTGQSDAFARNAEALGINLEDADALILSHGHSDHSGGLAAVLPKMKSPIVYLHPAALLERYSAASAVRLTIRKPDAVPAAHAAFVRVERSR